MRATHRKPSVGRTLGSDNSLLGGNDSPLNTLPTEFLQLSHGETALKQALIASYCADRMSAESCIALIRFFGLEGA